MLSKNLTELVTGANLFLLFTKSLARAGYSMLKKAEIQTYKQVKICVHSPFSSKLDRTLLSASMLTEKIADVHYTIFKIGLDLFNNIYNLLAWFRRGEAGSTYGKL